MSILKEICEELDVLVLDYFATQDEIYQHRSQLETDLKDGHLLMAKARYSMGAKSISSLQYNEDDLEEALYHVDIDSVEDGPTFHLSQTSPCPTDKDSPEQTDAEGLRRRNPQTQSDLSPDVETLSSEDEGFQVVQKKTPKDKKDEENTGDVEKKSRKDPLKWFGVLVPQALRQSQDRFKRAVQGVCTIATLQAHLLQVKTKFKKLHAKKESILNEVSDLDDDDTNQDITSLDKYLSPSVEEIDVLKSED